MSGSATRGIVVDFVDQSGLLSDGQVPDAMSTSSGVLLLEAVVQRGSRNAKLFSHLPDSLRAVGIKFSKRSLHVYSLVDAGTCKRVV